MASILPFDELNNFTLKLRSMFPDGKLPPQEEVKEEEEDIIDEMLDLFLLAYAQGNSVTSETLSFEWTPSVDDAMEVIDKEVAGKTWRQRVEDYFANGGSVGDLIRTAETETHRDANESALSTAKRAGAKYGASVGVFSLEMSTEQLATRLLAQEAGIPSHKIRQGIFKNFHI